jgi:chromosomal replication initiator protein
MKIKMSTIAKIVCKEFNVTREQLESSSRIRKFSIPRQAFYYVCHNNGHSFTKIGMFVGGRDHTTIMHGKRMAEGWIGIDRLNKIQTEAVTYSNNYYRLDKGEEDV